MRSFNVSLVSSGATSWLFIEFLFLHFHIAHIVIVIRMHSLSESLLWSSSKVKAAAPLIKPNDTSGQFLIDVLYHVFLAVAHARS